jgi:hydrogenase maturation protease
VSDQLRVLIAGFGNPTRGDDGAGWWVAHLLQEWWDGEALRPLPYRSVSIVAGQQPLPEWAPLLAQASLACFIDAVPVAPGQENDLTVALRPLERTTSRHSACRGNRLLDGHAVGPEGLLDLSDALYGAQPEAHLVAIPAYELGFSDRLSPATAVAVGQAVALVQQWLGGLIDSSSCSDILVASNTQEVLQCA